MSKTCEKCIHHDVCRYPVEGRAYPETCWKYKEERPHGEWIYHKEWELDGECAFECSKCGMGTDTDYNFCPNCGLPMKKEGEAE